MAAHPTPRVSSDLQSVLHSAPAMVAVHYGPQHIYVYSNPLHDRAVGNRSLIGLPLADAMPDLRGQGVFERFDEVLRSGKAIKTPEFSASFDREGMGRVTLGHYSQTLTPWRDETGAVVGVISFATDISEQVEVRKDVERERNQLQLIADQTPVLIAQLDANQRFEFVNMAYETLFGMAKADIIGQRLQDVLGVGYVRVAPFVFEVLKGNPVQFEVDMPFASGTRVLEAKYAPRFASGIGSGSQASLLRSWTSRRIGRPRKTRSR